MALVFVMKADSGTPSELGFAGYGASVPWNALNPSSASFLYSSSNKGDRIS